MNGVFGCPVYSLYVGGSIAARIVLGTGNDGGSLRVFWNRLGCRPRREREDRISGCDASVITPIVAMVAMIIMMVIATTPVTSMVLVVAWRGKEATGQDARPGEDEQTAS